MTNRERKLSKRTHEREYRDDAKRDNRRAERARTLEHRLARNLKSAA